MLASRYSYGNEHGQQETSSSAHCKNSTNFLGSRLPHLNPLEQRHRPVC